MILVVEKYHFSDKERVRLPLYLRDKITNQMCYASTKTYFLAKTEIVKKSDEKPRWSISIVFK